MKKITQNPGANQIAIAVLSAIPLFSGASGIREVIFLGGSVFLSVLIFEGLFFVSKRFWPRSFRPLLALVVLTSLLSGIFLICGSLFLNQAADAAAIFPLTSVSAFLLVHSTIFMKASLGSRVWAWGGFFAPLLAIGAIGEWNAAFQTFSPGLFWVTSAVLVAFFFLGRRQVL